MERIAPLAKILAEANGIEWQDLHGTGAGDQIVEQDILDYLSRVMSGEAEPPSTPVDAPPPDWNGEDIPGAGMFDVSALSRAGVDSDITDFVQQGRPAGVQPAAPQVPGTSAPALASDDFELEDAPDVVPPPAVSVPVPTAAPVAPVAPAFGAAGLSVPSTPVSSTLPGVAGGLATGAAGVATGGLGSLLSRLYHKEEAPAAVPAPEVQPAPVIQAPQVSTPSFTAPEVKLPEVKAPEVAAPAFTAPSTPLTTPAMPTVPAMPATPAEPAVTAPAFTAPVPAENRIAVPVAPAMPTPAASFTPEPEPVASPAPAPSVPAAPSTAATPEVPRDAVWFGTYLRRSADVSQLSDLRGQLSEALEQDVPLALLVARAAQRHADTLGLKTVAMQDVQANEAHSVGEGSLREALQASHLLFSGQPDLLIVDAGTLELDDLHYPHTTTLSVGRVEGGRAGLSIQGDVDQAKAAQFLAAVAQTLEKPVILLV
ncbi:E3 binding domain-containing protein [Deinococcus sp.]|uniref:E3 binding domain-containing protein n=1 Tax=Deinococcus sp. TaxID=47478 RepID=UPI0025BB7095|nr:E3 binding domain-containing protein [Deinococcus sp.]